jgi:hypothetical protein
VAVTVAVYIRNFCSFLRSRMAFMCPTSGCMYSIVVLRSSWPVVSRTRDGSLGSSVATVPNVCRAQYSFRSSAILRDRAIARNFHCKGQAQNDLIWLWARGTTTPQFDHLASWPSIKVGRDYSFNWTSGASRRPPSFYMLLLGA